MVQEKKETHSEITPEELVLDIHTHSIMSGHAYGTIREMAAAAKIRGLQLMGVSEHAPGIPGTCDRLYFSNIWVAPRLLDGLPIQYGCEINVLNDGTLSLEQKYIDKLDYAIVGIHSQCYENAGAEKNTENAISCMKNPKVVLMSHPDDDHTPLVYERLVEGAKENHVALEVNNSSFLKQDQRLNCVANYRKMLALCEKLRVPIVVSSDAHDPAYVGRFAEACALLNEIGFDRELILNLSVERWMKHIGKE